VNVDRTTKWRTCSTVVYFYFFIYVGAGSRAASLWIASWLSFKLNHFRIFTGVV